jgi:multiple sugar transport system permease protein
MGFTSKRKRRMLRNGILFILPNVVGFLAFTLLPLIVSFCMAFTNWDVRLHNNFTGEWPRFVWFENFRRLVTEPDFFQYLGNTLFLMMGIPFGIAGSLGAALLLNNDLHGGHRRVWAYVLAAAGLTAGTLMLLVAGLRATPMFLMFGGVAGLILLTGSVGGKSVYRTLFYFPHFTAGVATFLLWKKMFNPHTGPLNNTLRPALQGVESAVRALPAGPFAAAPIVASLLIALAVGYGLSRLVRGWRQGDLGWLPLALGAILLCAPVVLGFFWSASPPACYAPLAVVVACGAYAVRALLRGRQWTCAPDRGIGHGLILSGGLMVLAFVVLGLGNVLYRLPAMSAEAEGLAPPEWLTSYHWAKPSLMIMGLWASVGSNNMLLYLAGLSNVPQQLYEAADIDGASRLQRFWHVTWPQLAPVTFFIVIMSMIGGLRGGFEMARVMTNGGPAGATTTLSYYLYIEGFQTGRLGFASAVAWALFALIFAITMFNWKFGNRYTNY